MVAGGGDPPPHRGRPVLVVSEGHQPPGTVQDVHVLLEVEVGEVGQRQVRPLGLRDQALLVVGDDAGAVLVVRPVEADGVRTRVEAVSGPPYRE